MVDSALFAIRELMQEDPRCLLYGQDVGARLGGVFREAATLAAISATTACSTRRSRRPSSSAAPWA
jgi:pyruvate/2-oxoglutarate/acetoin dehydrogenase E1 component